MKTRNIILCVATIAGSLGIFYDPKLFAVGFLIALTSLLWRE